ncbi:lectin-like [Xyrauchen texanus]|uniref:lectin-like n=1 Tax=Xyrauchen texanus TaxID=154827 RepID=UPI0022422841|nr:lectin-like [Xyrauchen texanus]
MGTAGINILLITLCFASGNALTMERVDTAGNANVTSYCRIAKPCNVDGFNDWFRVDKDCVKYFNTRLNFSEAEFSCRKKAPGGHLVSLHNKNANDDLLCIVQKLNPKNLRIWLGGYSFFQSGKFLWTDGSYWDYQIWTPGEPNNIFTSIEECVEMNWKHIGMWNDASCTVQKNYFCAFKRKRNFDE